jgi:uncharacterized protein YndB with AHSA1/START domain
MWQYEYAQTTGAPAERVWALWADVSGWTRWNPDVRAAELDGPFAPGSGITMTLGSGDVVPLRIVAVEPGLGFADEATLDGVTLRTEHRAEPLTGGGARVVYATTVTGAAPAEVLAEIGAAVTADFPETVAGLLEACAASASHSSARGAAESL